MSELVEFIRGCLDADEQTARAATPGPWEAHTGRNRMASITVGEDVWVGDIDHDPDAAHIARHDPARVLADCEALRAVVAALVDAEDMIERIGPDLDKPGDAAEWANYHAWREAVELLAQPFAGRPGWRDEWGTNGHKEAEA